MEAGIPCFTIAPLSPVPPPSPAHRPTRATYFNRTTRPYFNSTTAGSGGGNGGSQKWSRNNREWVSSSVDFEEYEFFNKNDDVGGAAKQRIWWSNDSDDDNWDDDFGENEFWGFKTIRAFGWMIPAVTVSFLLGTDNSNAFFMALAVPLGQTVISLIIDKVWASTTNGPKSRSRVKKKKKKPFTEAAGAARRGERREESKTSNGRARSERSEDSKPSTGRASYRSRMARDDGSYKNLNKRTQKFGGWDDLDKDSYKVPRGKPSQNEDLPPKQHNRRKLSRIRRVKEEPLLLRLLIAVFPFLGSWTRILF